MAARSLYGRCGLANTSEQRKLSTSLATPAIQVRTIMESALGSQRMKIVFLVVNVYVGDLYHLKLLYIYISKFRNKMAKDVTGSVNKLYIKNMVCNRCIMTVQQIFADLNIGISSVSLGEVALLGSSPDPGQLKLLDAALNKVGFERIDDSKSRLIEKIKSIIIEKVHHSDIQELKYNWSYVLSSEIGYEYNYLSSLFSSIEGTTLEHYIIHQKIEKAKELIYYDELNTSEIAYRLGYSSVQHLSTQFKKVTGYTPSGFKKSRDIEKKRRSIDSI